MIVRMMMITPFLCETFMASNSNVLPKKSPPPPDALGPWTRVQAPAWHHLHRAQKGAKVDGVSARLRAAKPKAMLPKVWLRVLCEVHRQVQVSANSCAKIGWDSKFPCLVSLSNLACHDRAARAQAAR